MTDRDTPATDRVAPTTDPDSLREIAEEVARLTESAARLRTLGDDAGLPVVERTAKRIEGVASTLEDNVPPELYEE